MSQDKDLNQNLEEFLNVNDPSVKVDTPVKVETVGADKSILERINKKILTEDGRQLLI